MRSAKSTQVWEIFFKFLWPSQNIWTLPTRPSRAKAMKKSRLWRLKLELPQWILVHSWEGHKIWEKLFLKLLSWFFFSNSCGLRISELYPPVLHGQRQRKNQGFEAWSFNYLNGFWFTAERVTKILFKCEFFSNFCGLLRYLKFTRPISAGTGNAKIKA